MLRTWLQAMRHPRYAGFAVLMIFVALGCVAAGTWQIERFNQKVHANDALRANARAAAVPVNALLPLVGTTDPKAPSRDAVRYREVRATGRYDNAAQGLVQLRSVNSVQGYFVLTPFITTNGTLLVARGFVAETGKGTPPASIRPAPTGTVTITGRVQTPETRTDTGDGLPAGQLWSVNPADQAKRLGRPVYDGSAELLSRQPGTAGLTAIPRPDLSNPAGGAVEPQHFAYIVQWYLFALLALIAPVAVARSELRPDDDSDIDEHAALVRSSPAELNRAAKLADRYGRPIIGPSGRLVRSVEEATARPELDAAHASAELDAAQLAAAQPVSVEPGHKRRELGSG